MFELRFVAFGAALIASTHAFALRPLAVTLPLFAVACLLVRYDRLWLMPWLVLVWVNFHGGAIFGVVAVVAAAASDVASGRMTTARDIRRRAGILTLTAAATLVSPLGTRFWTFIPESATRSASNQLLEWASPALSLQFLPFWLAAAALVVLTLRNWRFVDHDRRRVVAIALAILPLAVSSMRTVPVFFLAGIPAITILAASPRSAAFTAQSSRAQARGENLWLNGAIRIGVIALAAAGVWLVWQNPPASLGWQPVSSQAATAIAGCGSPLYNTYNRGGEIIWFVPEQKVFVDNRHDPYPTALLTAARTLEQSGDFRAVFGRYGIRCAAVPPDSLVAASLQQAGWSIRYQDGSWLILTPQRPK
jgi:hypothetical protein